MTKEQMNKITELVESYKERAIEFERASVALHDAKQKMNIYLHKAVIDSQSPRGN